MNGYVVTCRLADLTVRIRCLHRGFLSFCRDYACEDQPQLEIVVKKEDIDFERSRAQGEFSEEYLELLAVYRKFCEAAAEYSVALFHSSAIEADGKAYLFSAPSGTGKSTHASLWRKYFPDRVRMINDDKPLLRFTEGEVRVYGTPWNGKHRVGENICAPLGGICFLRQAKENSIRPLDATNALLHVVPQIYLPRGEKECAAVLKMARELTKAAPQYLLDCNISEEAARLSFETLTQGEKQ